MIFVKRRFILLPPQFFFWVFILFLFGKIITSPNYAFAASESSLFVEIENTGPSPITELALGFDLPPLGEGQNLDRVLFHPDFGFSKESPLLPGKKACSAGVTDLPAQGMSLEGASVGTFNKFDGTISFGSSKFLPIGENQWKLPTTQEEANSPNLSFAPIVPDATILIFDISNDAVEGGKLVGAFKFLSSCQAQATRADLIAALEKYKNISIDYLDGSTRKVANSYALTAQTRAACPIGPFCDIIRELFKIINKTLGAVSNVITNVRQYFTADTSTFLLQEPNLLNTFMTALKGAQKGFFFFTDVLFIQNFTGLFEDAKHFDIALTSLSNTEEQTLNVLRGTGDFGAAQNVAYAELTFTRTNNIVLVPQRSGPKLNENSRPKSCQWANGMSKVKRTIREDFDSLIASIPDPLPSGFPTAELITYINQKSNQLSSGFGTAGPVQVEFQIFSDGINEETRKITLGMVNQGALARDLLYDAWQRNLDAQVEETIVESADAVYHVVTFGLIGEPSTPLKVAKGVHDLYKVVDFPEEVKDFYTKEMDSRESLQQLSWEMTTDLTHEAMNVWALSDSIRSVVKKNLGVSGQICSL